MTQQIIAAANPLGISVHDHIIVGKEGHTSLKGLKLLRLAKPSWLAPVLRRSQPRNCRPAASACERSRHVWQEPFQFQPDLA